MATRGHECQSPSPVRLGPRGPMAAEGCATMAVASAALQAPYPTDTAVWASHPFGDEPLLPGTPGCLESTKLPSLPRPPSRLGRPLPSAPHRGGRAAL